MRKYRVTWMVKRRHCEFNYEHTFEAETAEQARMKFYLWYDETRCNGTGILFPHPFHVTVKLEKNAYVDDVGLVHCGKCKGELLCDPETGDMPSVCPHCAAPVDYRLLEG